MHKDFQQFFDARQAASNDFVNGNAEPLRAISARQLPATIFGPKGDCIQGASAVNEANAKSAKMFEGADVNTFEVMHKAVDGELAYWVGIQRSVVHMHGKDEPVPMDLRVTEIFRREVGEWKLVHRHADKLASG
jgi:ketosteroid isomerase-like protein